MTEPEWLACDDPAEMLTFLRRRASSRKLRLFACDCARRIWTETDDEPVPDVVHLSEQYADGEVERPALADARSRLGARGGYSAAWAANQAEFAVLERKPWECANQARLAARHYRHYLAEETGRDGPSLIAAEKCRQVEHLRDIVGNPFRPVIVDPCWLTATVVALAETIYADRAFDRLPILADALQDAGCEDADLLAHCRGPGPHVRGCWAVDLVLGKT